MDDRVVGHRPRPGTSEHACALVMGGSLSWLPAILVPASLAPQDCCNTKSDWYK